jgi:2-methylcitrate synthase/citrate synthase II
MSEDIKKGLAGVVVDETAVSKVNPETNSLIYRGYPVQDLCAECRFEEVAYLMWHGELPTKAQLDDFQRHERGAREISDDLIAVIGRFPKSAHPMDTVRTGVSFLGMEDKDTWNNDPDDLLRKSVEILAKTPTIVATDYRFRKGLDRIAPREDLTFAENFFHMCFGEVPEAEIVDAFDVSLILYAEHSFNASTFTGRVIASTLADIFGAVTGAIAALKGPLHGGANEAVMHTLLEIGEPEKAQAWIDDAIDNKKLVMGFGHRVYKHGDSRVPTMTKAYHDVARIKGGEKWVEISKTLEKTFIDRKGIYPNLDFPAGPAYYLMGFDIDLFTPIFVMSRITGWTAHIIEQLSDNKLIRPLSDYVGPDQREVPPIDQRR